MYKILLLHIYMKLNMFWVTRLAHHHEPKTALAASGLWWTLSGTVCLTTSTNYTSNNLPHTKKPEAASAVLGS
jgi:hypothetical protein